MALTYTWQFPALECYPEQGAFEDVVFTVHWRLQGADEAGHSADTYGTVGVTYEEGQEFVPFAELTPEIVQGWVEAALGEETVAAAYAAIQANINEQVTPTRVTKAAPWTVATPAPEPTPEPEPEPEPDPAP